MSEFKKVLTDYVETLGLITKVEQSAKKCPECGGLGGSMQWDDNHGEVWVPCFECWWRSLKEEKKS